MARLPIRLPKAKLPKVTTKGKKPKKAKSARRKPKGVGEFLADWLMDWWFDFDLAAHREKKAKLGIFGNALGQGVSGGVDTGALPTMEEPQRVSNVNNPTIATISKQLDTLVKTANKIGLQTKQQQDALLSQMAQARRVAKEQQLEQKAPSIPEMPAGIESTTNDSLTPLDTSAKELNKKIDELTEALDQNGDQGGGGILSSLLNGLGLASLFGGKGRAARAATKVAARPTVKLGGQVLEKTGNRWQVVTRAADGSKGYSFASRALAEQAERRLANKSTNPLIRALNFASGRSGRVAAAPVASGASSSRLAGVLGGSFRNAARRAITGGSAIKDAVRRAAGPIITRALGSTALKSIPLLGIGAGIAFALNRLMQGDPVGAGLDLASGLGGPLTAIPALAATVSRDVYSSVYGVQPEQDPEFGPRMADIKSAVEAMIREQLGAAVEPKRTPTGQEIASVETPPSAPVRVTSAPPAPPAAASPPSGAPSGTGTTSTGGAGAATSRAAPSTGGAPRSATASPAPAADTGQQLNAASTMPENTGQMTGEFLNAQALPADDSWSQYGFAPDMGRFMPQTGQTSRGGAQGIGNIPDPVYYADNLEDLKTTLFFQYGLVNGA